MTRPPPISCGVAKAENVHAKAVGRVLVHETPVGAGQQALLGLAHGVHIVQRAVAAQLAVFEAASAG